MPAMYYVMNDDSSDRDRAEKIIENFTIQANQIPNVEVRPYKGGKNVIPDRQIKKREAYIRAKAKEYGIELRPGEVSALERLIRSKNYNVDARAIVYYVDTKNYDRHRDIAISYCGLNPAMSHIRKLAAKLGYEIITVRGCPGNKRLASHFRLQDIES